MNLFGLGSGAVWLWLVLVPVSGWLVLQSLFLRHRMWGLSGYNRYFLIVLFGIFSLIAGIAIAGVIGRRQFMLALPAFANIWQFPLGAMDMLRDNPLGNRVETTVDSAFVTLFWSAPAGFVFGLLVHALSWAVPKRTADEWRAEYLAEVNGILNFAADANKRRAFVMVTLSNRKVYIGWPQGVSDWDNPNPSKQYLYFMPIWSGFRKQDSLELEITTHYDEAYRKKYSGIAADFGAEISAWEIVLPVHEIIHAQPFDPEFYKEIQRANPKTKPASKRKTPPKPGPARRK